MADETSSGKQIVEHTVVMDTGSSLLPMLIGGLVMITLGMAIVIAFI